MGIFSNLVLYQIIGKRIILFCCSLVLSISSLTVEAKPEIKQPLSVSVKKYSSGKPGYKKYVIGKTEYSQSSTRKRLMKFRNHP